MARALYVRLALVLLAAVPTAVLYASTVLDLPYLLHHSSAGPALNGTTTPAETAATAGEVFVMSGSDVHQRRAMPAAGRLLWTPGVYGDDAAPPSVAVMAIDGTVYAACVIYALASLVLWTWIGGQHQLMHQLLSLPGFSSHASRQLSFFFIGVLPVVLVAIQAVGDPVRYRDLFVNGNVTLDALLVVGFNTVAAFTACAQLWFSFVLQMQLRSFELGQDRQRFTRKIYFLYSPSSPPSPSTNGHVSGKSVHMDADNAHDHSNRAQVKAYELAMDPAYAGFAKAVMVHCCSPVHRLTAAR